MTTLHELLQRPTSSETAVSSSIEDTEANELGASVSAKAGPLGSDISAKSVAGSKATGSREDKYTDDKNEALARNIIVYKDLFERIARVSNGPGFLMLDDLYHLRLPDQPKVVDYFHRIVKNTSIWLKIGTVKHRSRWYVNSNPPVGMKLTDDADDVDLDVTLEKFDITKRFLMNILEQFFQEVELRLDEVLTEGARDRLVLASGGVARDFLSIFRRSIDVTRERVGQGNLSRGEKIGAEDVNVAAGEYDSYKREEFSNDTEDEERKDLLAFFELVRTFCIDENKSNCLLADKDLHDDRSKKIDELVDLKFLHRINPRVTVRNRPGRIFSAFMLDLSQYVGARKQRNLELLEFWRPERIDDLRKSGLIFIERPWRP